MDDLSAKMLDQVAMTVGKPSKHSRSDGFLEDEPSNENEPSDPNQGNQTKASQEECDYTEDGPAPFVCRNCIYEQGTECRIVEDEISPDGACKWYCAKPPQGKKSTALGFDAQDDGTVFTPGGGIVPPGRGKVGQGDTEPAMLEPGEYVLPTPMAQAFGYEALDSLRRVFNQDRDQVERREGGMMPGQPVEPLSSLGMRKGGRKKNPLSSLAGNWMEGWGKVGGGIYDAISGSGSKAQDNVGGRTGVGKPFTDYYRKVRQT